MKPDKAGSWHPGDAQLGWIIENRLDETYLLSWPGPLEIYVPLHDTGGYDRARAPLGSYDFRLDQVKGTAKLYSGTSSRSLSKRRHFIRARISISRSSITTWRLETWLTRHG